MRPGMQDSHRDLMDAFLRCIVLDEGFADDVAVLADQCEQDGNHAVAAAMRNISRTHRIRGMENRAQVAALDAMYADNPGADVE